MSDATQGPFHRVQIVADVSGYFKKGQFGYVVAVNSRGGLHRQDKPNLSKRGEATYLVAKTKDARGGALWFSKSGVRITRRGRR